MARYALVIGISRYENFRNLDKAATDAAAIARILQTHGQYQVEPLPKRLVEVENRWELATDKKLTGKDLGQALETFLLERAKDQEALIYFAGHGFEVPGLGRKKKGYLATSDSVSDGRNAILFSDLNDLIRESSLSNLVLILDCCHAGSFLERTMLESTLTAFKEKKDYYLITACRSFERAREGEEHGVFTAAVLEGLQRDNADSEGTVTGDRLFDFVQRELRQSGQEPIRMGVGRSLTLLHYLQTQSSRCSVNETCPYQGLRFFDETTKDFFFGRKKVIETLKQKLEQVRFVPVIGNSGSGKSSIVRAGLIPWLKAEGNWQILPVITPSIDPLGQLKQAFAFLQQDPDELAQVYAAIDNAPEGLNTLTADLFRTGRWLLVVDQFEETFTLCPHGKEAQRDRFIELLTQVTEQASFQLSVVLAMRADFLSSCLRYESLTQLIQQQAVYISPLSEEDLQEAIVKPAELQGYNLEPGLLEMLLEDVRQEPECLPLLQFTLTELWKPATEQSHQLSLSQYRELGRLAGTLNRRANEIYDAIGERFQEQGQAWVRRIFLSLVRTGETKDTRQRCLKADLLAIADNKPKSQRVLMQVLDRLVRGRLLVTGGKEQAWVDLSHETLIEGWHQFAKWRQENRDLRRLADRVRDAYQEWLSRPEQEQDNYLMMGGLLAEVRENWQELKPYLLQAKEFFQHSDAHEKDRVMQMEELLKQSQALAEELQLQQKELTVTNQQLEQQAHALLASEELLKNQQEQLQLTNQELEEKAELLFMQKRELERKNNEIEQARWSLQEKAEQLALSSKYKSEFVANVSHELRTPLNSLLILARLLSDNNDRNLTDKQVEYVHTIFSAGYDLLSLINDILDLSKIESGTMSIDINPVQFVELREHLQRIFAQIAQDKHLEFVLDFADHLPPTIQTDSKRLQQILKNLLANAFKFTEQGQVMLEVGLAATGWREDNHLLNEAESVITFTVRDTGIGIAAEKQQIIFEAFQQADGTVSRRYGGTGLGLSISREIAHLLGGEIRLSSQLGEGSTFTLYLPQSYQAEASKYQAEIPRVARRSFMENELKDDQELIQSNDQNTVLVGKKLLIVDDDVRNIFALTNLLERYQMQVLYAENGRDGIHRLQSTPKINLVLMDIMMPEMDGYEAMQAIRNIKAFATLPIIAVTAGAMQGDREKSLAAGASDYITKPVDVDQLLSLMRVWLR